MRQLFFIEDSIKNKISYYHLAVFVITLPFDRFYSELALISFLVHTVIHITKTDLRRAFTIQTLLISSFFFIGVIGLLYSTDRAEGLKDLQKQLALLLFPVLLACCGLDLKKYMINLLLLFSFTCVFTTAYLFFDALSLIRYNHLPIDSLFTGAFINHNFSKPIGMHATYFSMYCLLSATVLFYLLLQKTTGKAMRGIYLLSLLLLLGGLLLLASRAVLISGVVIALCFPFLLFKGTGRAELIVIIAGIFAIGALLIANISSFKIRYVAEFKNDLTQESANDEILEPRIIRWEYILQAVRESPVTGYGTGSEKNILNKTWFDNKLYNSYLHELNSHNQYLGILVETGAWGLIIFVSTLLLGIRSATRQKNILFLSFLLIISIVFFSENILDANKGIFFYAFFFSLFVLTGKPFTLLPRFKRRQDNTA